MGNHDLVQKMTSILFKGLNFYFIPNNNSSITTIRKSLALENGALVNSEYTPSVTSHILIDRKLISSNWQVLHKFKDDNIDLETLVNVKVLDQLWLVDSIGKNQLLSLKDYEIDIDIDEPHTPKKRRIIHNISPSKSKQLEDSINVNISPSGSSNASTIKFLKGMAEEREIQGDVFKVKAYKTAINSLSKTDEHISTASQAMKLPGVGKSIALKIQEIAKTSKLKDLEVLQKSDESRLLKLFKGIHDVGTIRAQKWISEGMKTLEDISERDDLSYNQRLGLKYYNDWDERIPREECTLHNEYLLELMRDIDPKVELTIGGSYRRGSETCGDIDFMITKPNAEMLELSRILIKLIDVIKTTGYFQCELTKPSQKWNGGCSLPPQWDSKLKNAKDVTKWGKCRRIDFLLVPWDERGAAFIYFTGDDEFNKSLRLRARKRNMVLNNRGLYKRPSDDSEPKDKSLLIEGSDEKKIFELLGVKWREPKDRNMGHH